MGKRITALFLTVVLLFGTFPVAALAENADAAIASGECGRSGDPVSWSLFSSGLLDISGSGKMANFNLEMAPWYSYRNTITHVSISEGVTSIGNNAFYKCSSMTEITIPDGVTTIGNQAFYYCENLTGVTIPNSVTAIGMCAFDGCGSLSDITIPESVTSIGLYAFDACSSLTAIRVADGNPNYSSDSCGVLFNKDKTELITAPGRLSGDYAVPDSVSIICDSAFDSCTGLTAITIPQSVTSIGSFAFFSCSSLTDVHYGGTEAQWAEVAIGVNNTPLTDATIHFNNTGTGTDVPHEHIYEDGACTVCGATFLSGDVDCDGSVGASDMNKIKELILLSQWTSDELLRGDMNTDSKLSVTDILLVKKVIFKQ